MINLKKHMHNLNTDIVTILWSFFTALYAMLHYKQVCGISVQSCWRMGFNKFFFLLWYDVETFFFFYFDYHKGNIKPRPDHNLQMLHTFISHQDSSFKPGQSPQAPSWVYPTQSPFPSPPFLLRFLHPGVDRSQHSQSVSLGLNRAELKDMARLELSNSLL